MASPRPVPALTDDLLEEIFLRIGSPADLARASTACVAFRCLIADPSFLHQYRSLHPPLLLGLLDSDGCGFQPPDAPHPSAALSRAIARTVDFTLNSYFPPAAGAHWVLWDIRDGRILFRSALADDVGVLVLPEFAVCDPLARRCLLLPPIPDHFLAYPQVPWCHFDAALVPSGDDEDDTSLRVIFRIDFTERVVVYIFSSDAGRWRFGTSISWDALNLPLGFNALRWPSDYAYGCFYWKISDLSKCLKLDMSSMEFSIVGLSPGCDTSFFTIVEAGQGKLGMFSLVNDDTSLCYCTIRQNGGERSDQLNLGNIIPLPVGHCYGIRGASEGHIFISTYQYESRYQYKSGAGACFALEIKTWKVERVCQRCRGGYPFPPSMSQRRI